jgi:hypothetical protein
MQSTIKSWSQDEKPFFNTLIKPNNISLVSGTQYGLYPMLSDSIYPVWIYKTTLSANVSLLNLPLNASYTYSNQFGTAGINSGFQISLDTKAQNRMKSIDGIDSKAIIDGALDSIQNRKSLYYRRLDYLTRLDPQSQIPNISLDNKPTLPSSVIGNPIEIDSLNLQNHQPFNTATDSLKINPDSVSVSEEIAKYKQLLDELQNTENLWKAKKLAIEQYSPETVLDSLYSNKAARIEKFNIGFFGAEMSPLLIQSTVLKGIQVAAQKGDYYAEFALGRTLNSQIQETTNQTFKQRLNEWRNVVADNRSESSRALFAARFGKGQKDSTHFYLGGLVGQGKKELFSENSSTARNIVGEVEYTYIQEKRKVQLNAAQSFLRDQGVQSFDNNVSIRSGQSTGYAFHLHYKETFEKPGIQVGIKGKYFSPLFTSFGLGVSRKDYLQSDGNVSKSFKKFGRWSLQLRKDLTNLSNSLPVTVSLNQAKVTWSIKPIKRSSLNLNYIKSSTSIETGDQTTEFFQNVFVGVGTYQFKWGKKTPVAVLQMNSTQLSTDSVRVNYLGGQASLQWMISKSTSVTMSGNYSESRDSTMNKVENLFSEFQLSTAMKSLSLGCTMKMGTTGGDFTYGFGLNGQINMLKGLSATFFTERVVFDKGITSFYTEVDYLRFPYRMGIELTYTLMKSK